MKRVFHDESGDVHEELTRLANDVAQGPDRKWLADSAAHPKRCPLLARTGRKPPKGYAPDY